MTEFGSVLPPDAVTDRGPDLPPGLGSLLTATLTPVITIDQDGVIAFVNDAAALLLRLGDGRLVGQPIEVVVPCLQGVAYVASSYRHLPDPPPGRTASRTAQPMGIRPDGTEFPAEVNLTPVELDDGRLWAVVTVRDVSARVRAQRQVAELSTSYLTLAEMNHAVVRAPDAEALFAATCRIAVEQGGYLGAWVGVPLPDGRVDAVAQAGSLGPYINELDIRLDPDHAHRDGPVARSLREERPCFSKDFLGDPTTEPWHERAGRHGIASAASFPLRTAGAVVATLTLYAGRPTAFDHGVGDLLGQVTDNVSFALDGFASARALVAGTAARRGLLMRLVTAEENERGRIAGDLHDDSVQVLAAVNLRLGLLSRRVGTAPEVADVASMVRTITETVRLAADSLRTLLFQLAPPLLTQSLTDALGTTAAHVFEGEATTWAVHCVDEVELPDLERGQALRIVKEALINVCKHAHASHIDIDLRSVDGGIEIAVRDNGEGLLPGVHVEDLPRQRGHRGFETMRDRATATGGWCRLERRQPHGATLRFFIPVTEGG
ncbi:GAF domain-containing protein [Dermatophilaceae bacterium Soc4.6]